MKIAFMGSSEFSKIVLQALYNSNNQIVCVVTNPDKPVGRGGKVQFSQVKQFAIEQNIPVLQFSSVSSEGEQDLKNLAPDVLVTASFSHYLKSNILNLAPYGVINVHPSLLPKYRGSSPIVWAVANGEEVTGVTIMKTAKQMDAGNILSKCELSVLPDETAEELTLRLATLGGELLVKTLQTLESGTITETPQNELEATYYPKLTKEMGKIDFNLTATQIKNMCNAFNPWPVCFVENKSKNILLKVYKASPFTESVSDENNFLIGQVVIANAKKGLVVKCKDGFVLLDVIKSAGGKLMPSKVYLNGKKIEVGTQF